MYILLLLLALILASSSQAGSLIFRGKNITFGAKHGRSLASPAEYIVVKRLNHTYQDPIIVLSKGHFLVQSSSYQSLPGDEVTEWLPELKS